MAEFSLPPVIKRLCLACGVVPIPYVSRDDELQAIFIHIPKSAGTSLRKALYKQKSYHIPASRYKFCDSEKFESYFKFCFVRNPWGRLVSAFHYLYQKKNANQAFPDHRWAASNLRNIKGFEDFVLKINDDPKFFKSLKSYIHFRNQIDWISEWQNGSKKIIVDYIGRFETLQKDYEIILRKLNTSATSLTISRRTAKREEFRYHYGRPEMIDIVGRMYHEDISIFKYEFE